MSGEPVAPDPARAIHAEICRHARELRAERRRAADVFVHGAAADTAPAPEQAGADDLELTVADWQHLLPADATARQAVADLVAEHLGPSLAQAPQVCRVLGIDDVAAGDAGWATDPGAPLEHALDRLVLRSGTTLFRQGDPGDSLYVIARGRLRLRRDDEGGEATERDLGPDQTVGELALITGDVRSATVIAVRDTVLYRLGREAFGRCCEANPTITSTMLVTLAHRLSRPPARRPDVVAPATIAVVQAGRDAPVRQFAEGLHEFMHRHVPTALVTAASVDDVLGAGAADADPASRLGLTRQDHLTRLEERFEHVIQVAEDPAAPWADTCVRGADLVLLVGRAGGDPGRNVLEDGLFDRELASWRPRTHLVLVEPEATQTPTGTAPWLRHRPVELCHHLHLGWRSHYARLARFVVGAPVGLVLSGGAARAFAHIGVLRAVRDAGVPVDVVIGTSAGALIGGQFAMGWSPEQIQRVSAEVFGGPRRRMLDFVPPYTSLIGSTRFNAALDEIFGDVRFEDLWIQFLCTTTDLTSATGLTHRRGRLRPYVRASCSLPLVLPSVAHEGHLLADGGIVNNLPVDPLLAVTSVGVLVVVNVTSPFYTADEAYNYEDSVSLSRVLNGRFNPFSEKLVAPGILDVLMRSLEVGSKGMEPAQIAKASVYVRPDVERFGYTDVAALDEIVAEGERATVAALEDLGPRSIPFTDR